MDPAGPSSTTRLSLAAPWVPPTWQEVVEQHSARVYRLAYRLTGNVYDAEDLTQEVFVRVFRSLSTYTPGTFEGWLHRITTNLFLDQVRRKKRIRFDALAEDADARMAGREPDPSRAYDDTHLDDDVQAALDALAPGLPGRGGAVRHRGADLRGDRGDAGHQARHRALPDPPRPGPAARGPGPPGPPHRHPVSPPGRAPAGRLDRSFPRERPAARPRGPFGGGSPVGPHLGDRISALVDSALADDARDRALVHIAGCAQCRAELDAARSGGDQGNPRVDARSPP